VSPDAEPGASERPQDDGLWTMTLAAVRAADRVTAEHLADDGYCSRVEVPEVGRYDSGWPRLSRSFGVPDKGPPQRSSLFGTTQSILRPFAYDDVPELVGLIQYVGQRPDLRARLTSDRVGERQDWLIDFEAAQLPLTLLDRMYAVGAHDDVALLALYRERETAWLSDRLPVERVFPLALTALDLDEALVIDDRTRIEPLDDGTHAARAPRSTGGLDAVPAPVIDAATHAIIITDEIENPGPGGRIFGTGRQLDLRVDQAELICQALRVLTAQGLGFAQLLLRPLGWADSWTHNLPAMEVHGTVRRYPDWFDNYGWLRPPDPLPRDLVGRLPAVVSGLSTSDGNVQLAARRLSQARLRNDEDDRIIDACIGLEALLSKDRDELSHRLSLRAAAALSSHPTEPWRASVVYAAMKRIYEHRSTVVHGGSVKPAKRTFSVGSLSLPNGPLACRLLGQLLLDVLERPGGWTPDSLDAVILARLDTPPPDAGA